MTRLPEKLATLVLAGALGACSGTRQVETTPAADVLVLTPSYSVQANLGKAPVPIESQENIARYRLERQKGPPEFLLVLFPDKLGGPVPVSLTSTAAAAEATVIGTYFDQLLRAHRLVLRGDLAAAESLIARMQQRYDDGFGTSVLLGNIALLRGDAGAAARRFRFAKSLIPDAPVPADLLPKDGGASP